MRLSRLSQPALFTSLIVMSCTVPWTLQAIFPPSSPGYGNVPPEEPAEAQASDAAGDAEGLRRRQLAENYDWLGDKQTAMAYGKEYGEQGVDEAGAEESAVEAQAQEEETPAAEAEAPLDLSPGVFAAYHQSWDTLKVVRQRSTLGAFAYAGGPKIMTRVEGSYSELRFHDDASKIRGRSGAIDLAHQLGSRLLVEEGVAVNGYESFHTDLTGYLRGGLDLTRVLFLSITAAWEDMWERLPNIVDGLRVFSVSPYAYYQFLPRWWTSAYGSFAHYTDGNDRQSVDADLGYFLSPRVGLSLSGGVEATHFQFEEPTYWSPKSYTLMYGRLRLTKGFEDPPFIAQRPLPQYWNRRFGYLAEYTAGVTDRHDFEQSARAGLAWRATSRLSLRGEYYYLDSEGRFTNNYYEDRVDAKAVFTF